MALDIVEQERAAMPMQHLISAVLASARIKVTPDDLKFLQRIEHPLTEVQEKIRKQCPE